MIIKLAGEAILAKLFREALQHIARHPRTYVSRTGDRGGVGLWWSRVGVVKGMVWDADGAWGMRNVRYVVSNSVIFRQVPICSSIL